MYTAQKDGMPAPRRHPKARRRQNFSENCAVKAFCAAVVASWLV